MGDYLYLLTGKRNQPGQLSLPSLWSRWIEYQPVWLGLGGASSLVLGGSDTIVINGKW